MRNPRLFEVTDGFGSLRIAVVEARNSNGHGTFSEIESFVLSGDDVALKIQADVYRFSVPHSGAAPDALVVLFQAANIAEALRLDPRLGLTFGEAVRSGDRRPRIISVFAVDGFVVWPVVGGRVLCQRTARRKDEGNRRNRYRTHCHFLRVILPGDKAAFLSA